MLPKDTLTKTYNLLNELYAEKNEENYNEKLKELEPIGQELPVDLYREWRSYVKDRVNKQLEYKRRFWEKAKSGTGTKTWPSKSSYILREEGEAALVRFLDAMTNYINSKIN